MTHGCHGTLLISIDAQGYPLILMESRASPWVYVGIQGEPSVPMDFYGKPLIERATSFLSQPRIVCVYPSWISMNDDG